MAAGHASGRLGASGRRGVCARDQPHPADVSKYEYNLTPQAKKSRHPKVTAFHVLYEMGLHGLSELGGAIRRGEGVDDTGELIAQQHAVVRGVEADAVIGHAVLRQVVRADLL